MKNIHSDLDKFKDQWEKALKGGFLDDSPHLPEPKSPVDFFGQWDGSEEVVPMNECDTKYWNQVYQRSRHQGDAPCPLKEEAEATKDQIKTTTSRIANAANPIYPNSVGKDQDMRVTPNWTDGKELTELAELKARLEKLESQLNAQEALGKKGDSSQSKIESIKKQIDELSDTLAVRDENEG